MPTTFPPRRPWVRQVPASSPSSAAKSARSARSSPNTRRRSGRRSNLAHFLSVIPAGMMMQGSKGPALKSEILFREHRQQVDAFGREPLASALKSVENGDDGGDLATPPLGFGDRFQHRLAGGRHILDDDDAGATFDIAVGAGLGAVILLLLADPEALERSPRVLAFKDRGDHDRDRAHRQPADGARVDPGGLLQDRVGEQVDALRVE